jgi:hypothetical protein
LFVQAIETEAGGGRWARGAGPGKAADCGEGVDEDAVYAVGHVGGEIGECSGDRRGSSSGVRIGVSTAWRIVNFQ